MSYWYNFVLLAMEASSVVELRTRKCLRGGLAAFDEIELMVAEKQLAFLEASTAVTRGASANDLVDLFRTKVAANNTRLSRELI